MPEQYSNMRQYLIAIFILTTLLSCESQDKFIENRLETANKFVECLAKNNSDKILEYSYTASDYNLKDKESRDIYVNKAFHYISKFGLPSKEKQVIKYDPKNNFHRLTVRIPIFKGYDSVLNLIQIDIVLAFPPPRVSDKIYSFEINEVHDHNRLKPTLSPN